MNCNDEDLLDIITRQRLTIYHQERRIEALEKSIPQATNPTMTNDLVNQLFNQLQSSNELMALKAEVERLEAFCTRTIIPNEILQAEVERLKSHSFTAEELTSMKAETELLHAQFKRDLFNQVVEENERLDTLCKQLGKQHSDISCENIMLRKAGDAMAALIKYEPGVNTFDPIPQVVKKWNAAKESKPSV